MAALVIWKYGLTPGTSTLSMPARACTLSVQVQRGEEVVLYALVNPLHPCEERGFYVLATGETVSGKRLGPYIGTIEPTPGLWFHVFEQDS